MANENGSPNADEQAKAEAAAKAEAEAKAKAEAGKQETVPHEAFHAEREKRKAAEARAEKLEAEAKAKAEEEAAKRGEFEKLFQGEKEKNKTLEEQNKQLSERVSGFETSAKTRIETKLSTIKADADREVVKRLLDGKPLSEQEDLLPKLLERFSSPLDINANAGGGGGEKRTDKDALRQTAKEKKDVLGLIAHAPAVK